MYLGFTKVVFIWFTHKYRVFNDLYLHLTGIYIEFGLDGPMAYQAQTLWQSPGGGGGVEGAKPPGKKMDFRGFQMNFLAILEGSFKKMTNYQQIIYF